MSKTPISEEAINKTTNNVSKIILRVYVLIFFVKRQLPFIAIN